MNQLTFPFFESYLYWENHLKFRTKGKFVWSSASLANLSGVREIVEDELK